MSPKKGLKTPKQRRAGTRDKVWRPEPLDSPDEAKHNANVAIAVDAATGSRLKNRRAREALAGQLLMQLDIADHFAVLAAHRNLTADEAAAANGSTRNVLKLVDALGVGELRGVDDCPECDGSGTLDGEECEACDGSGEVD